MDNCKRLQRQTFYQIFSEDGTPKKAPFESYFEAKSIASPKDTVRVMVCYDEPSWAKTLRVALPIVIILGVLLSLIVPIYIILSYENRNDNYYFVCGASMATSYPTTTAASGRGLSSDHAGQDAAIRGAEIWV